MSYVKEYRKINTCKYTGNEAANSLKCYQAWLNILLMPEWIPNSFQRIGKITEMGAASFLEFNIVRICSHWQVCYELSIYTV